MYAILANLAFPPLPPPSLIAPPLPPTPSASPRPGLPRPTPSTPLNPVPPRPHPAQQRHALPRLAPPRPAQRRPDPTRPAPSRPTATNPTPPRPAHLCPPHSTRNMVRTPSVSSANPTLLLLLVSSGVSYLARGGNGDGRLSLLSDASHREVLRDPDVPASPSIAVAHPLTRTRRVRHRRPRRPHWRRPPPLLDAVPQHAATAPHFCRSECTCADVLRAWYC